MKDTIIKTFWGVVLVILGGFALADRLGSIDLDSTTSQMWIIIFASLSLAFFLSYFISGIRQWGWLFPALIFAALALVINPILADQESPITPMSILLAVGIPFYVGYLVNRKHWGLLIPAWILTVIAFIPALNERIDSNLVGAFFLYGTALPFLVVYLANRVRKWALVTTVTLAVIGSLPLLEFVYHGDLSGPIVMSLLALPFLVAFFTSQKNWWALIPAGTFASIGVVALLNALFPDDSFLRVGEVEIGMYSAILFLGFAITFGILWLLRTSRPTGWAIYPAVGCLAISALVLLFGQRFNEFLPAVVLMIIGLVMISTALVRRRGSPPADI
ncbi:MAG: hypothetical protein ACM3H7_06360 [Acidobacteriaceae bacterium]